MTTSIQYSPILLGYTVGLPQLSEENKRKTLCIEDINTLNKQLGNPPLPANEFDELYEKDIWELTGIIANLSVRVSQQLAA